MEFMTGVKEKETLELSELLEVSKTNMEYFLRIILS